MTQFGDADFDPVKYVDELMAKRSGKPVPEREPEPEPEIELVVTDVAEEEPETEIEPELAAVMAPQIPATQVAATQSRKKAKEAKPTRRITFGSLWVTITRRVNPKKWRLPEIKKRWVVLAAAVAAVVIAGLLLSHKYGIETVTSGMETSAGEAAGRIVIVDKSAKLHDKDLVVGEVAVNNGTGVAHILGTVYAINDQSIALYDGKLIWRVPLDKVDGSVLFITTKTTTK